ncbi:hypothetical protein A176_000437 [Myxococcus hansupus]|uniref:Uncharacterized protein n=1 Tax=Pseudomyxococcus hansupus TaxID=1297742 RepID=A0A0H4WQE1_9BACT|nr:hypothetical protein A176_000437 [Myxococcus hansupus]
MGASHQDTKVETRTPHRTTKARGLEARAPSMAQLLRRR